MVYICMRVLLGARFWVNGLFNIFFIFVAVRLFVCQGGVCGY